MQNEFEGKTVEDAIETGLKALGLAEHEADVDVLQKGARGIFGIGSSTALVRITTRSAESSNAESGAVKSDAVKSDAVKSDAVKSDAVKSDAVKSDAVKSDAVKSIGSDGADTLLASASDSLSSSDESSISTSTSLDVAPVAKKTKVADSDNAGRDNISRDSTSSERDDEDEISDTELADMAMDMLGKTVSLMGYDVEITALWKDPEPGDNERCLTLDVEGENLGPLIGRRGETLESLQYMLRLMVNQKIRSWCNIVVDVASYKSRRSEQLMQMAHRVAEQVAETGRAESMEPMPANERRIVHLALRDHADVYTESTGDSDRRKVHVVPRSLTS